MASVQLSIQREQLVDCWDDLLPLYADNYAEVSTGEQEPIDPDKSQYLEAEEGGQFALFTVRDYQRLVGYAQFFIGHNLHHRARLEAWHDATYLMPAYRGTRTGFRLLSHCDETLFGLGIQRLYQHVTPRSDHSPLLLKMGYYETETIYARCATKDQLHG